MLAESFRKASRLCAAATVAIGALVLAGWLFDVRAFMQVVPGAIAMVPNTAVGFLLAGLSLWLQAGARADSGLRVSRALAAAAGLLGLVQIAQYVSRADFGIDELLFRDPTGLTSVLPGRMAVSTALGFLAIAGALLFSGMRSARWLSDALALVTGLLGLLSLTGYAYGVHSLVWIGAYKGMAVHTALAFFLLTMGTLFARPDRPISRLILSESIGGVMVRRLLPFAIAIPFVLGWLERKGRRADLYPDELGDALLVVAGIVLVGIVVLWQGAALERIDLERLEATVEAKRAFDTLFLRERHFRSLIENAQDVITILDREGTIRFQGPAAERILGRPPKEFVGKSVLDFVHPDDTSVVQAAMGRVLGNPETVRTWLIRLRHANGSWRTMEVIGKLLPGEGSLQIVVNSRDVTESRALEEQLRQAQKMEAVGRLAGGIAHDFNNLLTAILGYGELASSAAPPDSPLKANLDEIRHAAERAAGLTRQLLVFSRKQVLQPTVLDLNAVVGRMEQLLRRLIGEDIILATALTPGVRPVRADRGQIEQVVLNLAVNARDAMSGGGRLTIKTANFDPDETWAERHPEMPSQRYVLLGVSDSGTGMDEATKSRIFEPFFTTKEAGKGTGLGLATAYGIVKQAGGLIEVDSEPGRGTRFRIYLPAAEGVADSAASGFSRGAVRGTETVLLVEDEDPVRRLVTRTLLAFGYEVLEAAQPADALRISREHPNTIDLLLTDVVMPGMNGPDLAARCRSLRPGLKVLFMSGYTAEAMPLQGLDPGVNFLSKPFSPSALAGKVREVLDAPA